MRKTIKFNEKMINHKVKVQSKILVRQRSLARQKSRELSREKSREIRASREQSREQTKEQLLIKKRPSNQENAPTPTTASKSGWVTPLQEGDVSPDLR